MDNTNLYLDSEQVMPYMEKLGKMSEFDPEYYDSFAYNFCLYVLNRKKEILKNHANKFFKKKNDDKFIISKAVMDYLSKLTGLSYLKNENNAESIKIFKKAKEVV